MNIVMLNVRKVERADGIYFVILNLSGTEFEFVLTPTDMNGISPQIRALVALIEEENPSMIKERIE